MGETLSERRGSFLRQSALDIAEVKPSSFMLYMHVHNVSCRPLCNDSARAQSNEGISCRHKPALVASLVHNTSGAMQLDSRDSPQTVAYSSASFNANDLSSDSRVLQVRLPATDVCIS